jgi:hypothetical protein
MKTLHLVSIIAALAAGISASTGYATTFYFIVDSGAWNVGTNWSTSSCNGSTANALPTATDDVVICGDNVAIVTNTNTISSAYAKTLTVESDTLARIDITPTSSFAATLTLGSGSSPLTSDLGSGFSAIALVDAAGSSNKATLAIVSADHTLVGDNSGGLPVGIYGQDELAEITIASGKTLACRTMKVFGGLKVLGDGKFVSEGSTVEAGIEAGTLLLAPYELDDQVHSDVHPVWSAAGGSTVLRFDAGISVITGGSLVGNFTIGPDPLDVIRVDEPITTTGGLTITSGATLDVNQNLTMGSEDHPCQIHDGSVDVAADKTFTHH